MAITHLAHVDDPQAHISAVSWSAVLAGATGSAALSLILLILGTGIGLSSVSPWSGVGVSATAFGVSVIVWLTVTQLVSSGLGGYIAGRLRTKWVSAHTDEVYFRDTAHGFLSWAVASLVTAALLMSMITPIVGSSVQAGTAASGDVASVATSTVNRGASILSGDTEHHVNEASGRGATPLQEAPPATKEAVDKARKASTYAALWLFASLLIGAFASSVAATWGGRQRDA